MSTTTDPISEAIIAHWGERYDDTMEGCPCCEAWAAYDRLRGPDAPVQEPPSPGVTAGAHEFYLGNVDARVAEMTDVDVWQLCLDGDEFERKGRIGDCLLRREAEAWMDRLGFAHDHVALRMMDFVHAAHKRRSIQAATPAPVVPAEGLERALLAHHEWHQRLGVIVFPPEDDQDGPTEIDMSAEYADSRLHEQTVAALSGASIVQSVDDHAHAALSHALQYLRGEAPNVMSGGHRNGQLRSMIKWVLLGCGGPLRSAPPVGARVTWIDLGDQMPPKDQPFLARNPGFAAFIAEWSETDQEYLTHDSADGWCRIGFSHWMTIPDLPAGEGE